MKKTFAYVILFPVWITFALVAIPLLMIFKVADLIKWAALEVSE